MSSSRPGATESCQSGNIVKATKRMNEKHIGSDFDDFLREEQLLDEAEATARQRVMDFCSRGDEWDESKWLPAAARNPAFDFLTDSVEDVYSLDDGKPFHDEDRTD
jgi:hypothetical protein